ncbi:hypothetical protein BGW80DRAFT_1176039 [Lactifluus volemus]|nr:hypothetical protein BGW80DRAFT_1176039 [Lactifluus volemus]
MALIQIDGVTHSIFGQLGLANQTNVTGTDISPTRTAFDFQIGPIVLRATFFSPIEPGDWVRQSTPFTYVSFELAVTDYKAHDIQLYMHTVIGWLRGFFLADADQSITWSTVSTGSSVYEMAQLRNQKVFSENAFGQAEWGQFYFATAMGDVVTYGVGPADTLVNTFITEGSLNTIPASPVEGTSDISTAFALSRTLGNVTNNATAIFALGFVQDPAIQYVDPAGQINRRVPYFKTKYSSTGDLIDAVIGDFVDARSRGRKLEGKMANVFESAGFLDDYVVLLSLATRLSYASTVLTVGESSEGVVDPTDVMMFMKNMGAANRNRVNPTETLYAAFPMFMYLDASLGALLLEPLLRYQNSSDYTHEYAGLDAGEAYHVCSFCIPHNRHIRCFLSKRITANMLIMIYAQALASGNASLIETYAGYPLLERWSEYLANTTLFTTDQESADLLSVNNQTNLAIKGIIAIKAMSFMSAVVGKSTDYSATADSFYARWKNLALGSDKHLLAQYKNKSSWSLGYNMFADLWLETNLISQDVRSLLSIFRRRNAYIWVPDIHRSRELPEDRKHLNGLYH